MTQHFSENLTRLLPTHLPPLGYLLLIIACLGCPPAGSAQSSQPLHVFEVETPEQLKTFLRYTPDRIPLVSAHRGGARPGYPENCLATFENTLRHTWSMLEVDPRYTRDSVIVMMHDATLDRTTTGRGKVEDQRWEDLQALKLLDVQGEETDYSIPTLDQLLEWARDKTILILDQKSVPLEDRVKKIQEHQAQAYAMVMAYNFADARRCYELDPDIMMEVFIPDREAAVRFEATGVPWENVVAFVTHTRPQDEEVIRYLHERFVMTIIGSSRTIDRAFAEGEISSEQLQQGYREILALGADIIEADLGVEAGKALRRSQEPASENSFFTTKP